MCSTRLIYKSALFVLGVTTLTFHAAFAGGAGLADGPVEPFVTDFYSQVLARSPARSEVSAWVNYLRTTRNVNAAGSMVHTFFESDEYRRRPVTPWRHVTLLYRAILGRDPEPATQAAVVYDLLVRFNTIIPFFTGAPEFQSRLRQGGPSTLVSRLYTEFLGRAPSDAETAGWVSYLAATADVGGVVVGFASSLEYQRVPRTLDQHVTVLYRALLGRDPGPGETTPWTSYLTGQLAAIEDAVIGSPEFRERYTGAPNPGPNNPVIPILQSPFADQFRVGQFLDHNVPQEFVDANGTQVAYWGEVLPFFDGHEGYDITMPEGTPLLAAGDGVVTFAGRFSPFFCPILNATTIGVGVDIEHTAPNGLRFRTLYRHMSRVDVQVGQVVSAGDPIGLSGNAGCSLGPHLHFGAQTLVGNRWIIVDPYGWEGLGPDPWAAHPQGTASFWLWKPGQAPALFKDTRLAPNPSGSTAAATITVFRWLGPNDAQNPNNEFVEVTLDPRFVPGGTFDLTGFKLQNNKGDTFNFPSGFIMQTDRAVRVYSGSGQNIASELFWGRASGVWDNASDCVYLVNPRGGSYRVANATGACQSTPPSR